MKSRKPSYQWKPSLTRPVLAGLWYLRTKPGASDALTYNLNRRSRETRKISQRNWSDLRKADAWLEAMIEWSETRKSGIKRRLL